MAWNILDDQVNWANLSSVPSDLADGEINWNEVKNKPLNIYNWTIPGPFNFWANSYVDLGVFPGDFQLFANSSSISTFLIQIVLQWSDVYYQTITASDIISFCHWLLFVPNERTLKAEHHFTVNQWLVSYYLGSGQASRNMFLKTNYDLIISSEGNINIKIISLV